MGKYRVSIVEDDKMIAESLSDILECLGHEVIDISDNGVDALNKLQEDTPDIILLDIQINGQMDGVDLAEQINTLYKIPYIFTTAFADPTTLQRAREKGPFGYIVKPYGMKDIYTALEIAMDNFQRMKGLEKRQNNQGVINNNQLYIKSDSRFLRIRNEDILYVEAKGDYALFKTKDNSYIVHSTMKNVENKLDKNVFIKVHRSFIVNLNQIVDIEDSNLLIDKKVIPISRANKASLMSRINVI